MTKFATTILRAIRAQDRCGVPVCVCVCLWTPVLLVFNKDITRMTLLISMRCIYMCACLCVSIMIYDWSVSANRFIWMSLMFHTRIYANTQILCTH